MKKIFIVDEEENVVFPDLLDLRVKGHETRLVVTAGDAVDWFIENKQSLITFAAFVIDVQLPTNGDLRFPNNDGTNGTFSGLKVCDLVIAELGPETWRSIQKKVVLYTRLPDTARMKRIQDFATRQGILLFNKRTDIRLETKLIELGLI